MLIYGIVLFSISVLQGDVSKQIIIIIKENKYQVQMCEKQDMVTQVYCVCCAPEIIVEYVASNVKAVLHGSRNANILSNLNCNLQAYVINIINFGRSRAERLPLLAL